MVATQEVVLEKVILHPKIIRQNKKTILSKKIDNIFDQPETRSVFPGSTVWLMFLSSKPNFSAMFFFEDEPLGWNWTTGNEDVYKSFISLEQVTSKI